MDDVDGVEVADGVVVENDGLDVVDGWMEPVTDGVVLLFDAVVMELIGVGVLAAAGDVEVLNEVPAENYMHIIYYVLPACSKPIIPKPLIGESSRNVL